jgi:hypothetical protein
MNIIWAFGEPSPNTNFILPAPSGHASQRQMRAFSASKLSQVKMASVGGFLSGSIGACQAGASLAAALFAADSFATAGLGAAFWGGAGKLGMEDLATESMAAADIGCGAGGMDTTKPITPMSSKASFHSHSGVDI